MIDKKIYRYSNVELIDIIKNGTEKHEIKRAESELKSRDLTAKQKSEIESEYLKYKEFKRKRKNEPLTNEEWLSFFILPFFTPKPRWRQDHMSDSEMERFKKYGFEKKANQAVKVRLFGILFWLLIILMGVLISKLL